MFIGHYGPAYAAKTVSKRLPLWVLFLAVQFLDIVWAILVMMGTEKLRVIHGFTASNALDLYYMPYTHGLLSALCLSVIMGGLSEMAFRQRGRTFLIVALCVLSHWILDLIVHVPDLPLLGNTMKVGFGLWQHRLVAIVVELAVLFVGLSIFTRFVRSFSTSARVWLWFLNGLMLIAYFASVFGPDPSSPRLEALTALFAYLLFAGLAAQVDRTLVGKDLEVI
jgi:hypothetical protein